MLLPTTLKITFTSFLVLGFFLATNTAHADINSTIHYLAPDPTLVKGETAFFAGDYEKAVVLLTRGLKKNLNTEQVVSVENALCASENELGNWSKAITHCNKAIKLDSQYWRAYINLGNSLKALGDKTTAYENYCRAFALSPKHVGGGFTKSCS